MNPNFIPKKSCMFLCAVLQWFFLSPISAETLPAWTKATELNKLFNFDQTKLDSFTKDLGISKAGVDACNKNFSALKTLTMDAFSSCVTAAGAGGVTKETYVKVVEKYIPPKPDTMQTPEKASITHELNARLNLNDLTLAEKAQTDLGFSEVSIDEINGALASKETPLSNAEFKQLVLKSTGLAGEDYDSIVKDYSKKPPPTTTTTTTTTKSTTKKVTPAAQESGVGSGSGSEGSAGTGGSGSKTPVENQKSNGNSAEPIRFSFSVGVILIGFFI